MSSTCAICGYTEKGLRKTTWYTNSVTVFVRRILKLNHTRNTKTMSSGISFKVTSIKITIDYISEFDFRNKGKYSDLRPVFVCVSGKPCAVVVAHLYCLMQKRMRCFMGLHVRLILLETLLLIVFCNEILIR